jgi:hypothetical protein
MGWALVAQIIRSDTQGAGDAPDPLRCHILLLVRCRPGAGAHVLDSVFRLVLQVSHPVLDALG